MAIVTICDVKVCGDIIRDSKDVKSTVIAGRHYHLCKKCSDGLLKFINENLNSPEDNSIAKLGTLENIRSIQIPQSQPHPLLGTVRPYSGLTWGTGTSGSDIRIGDFSGTGDIEGGLWAITAVNPITDGGGSDNDK